MVLKKLMKTLETKMTSAQTTSTSHPQAGNVDKTSAAFKTATFEAYQDVFNLLTELFKDWQLVKRPVRKREGTRTHRIDVTEDSVVLSEVTTETDTTTVD